jgi:hypothetical protein
MSIKINLMVNSMIKKNKITPSWSIGAFLSIMTLSYLIFNIIVILIIFQSYEIQLFYLLIITMSLLFLIIFLLYYYFRIRSLESRQINPFITVLYDPKVFWYFIPYLPISLGLLVAYSYGFIGERLIGFIIITIATLFMITLRTYQQIR